jgi:hypothetical protein
MSSSGSAITARSIFLRHIRTRVRWTGCSTKLMLSLKGKHTGARPAVTGLHLFTSINAITADTAKNIFDFISSNIVCFINLHTSFVYEYEEAAFGLVITQIKRPIKPKTPTIINQNKPFLPLSTDL